MDQQCSGQIAMAEVVTADEQARQHYLVSSLMEEAIRSSQLEGATTSRRVAKDLLKSGRAPKDRSEKMILNNYLALRFMRDKMGDTLTPALVLELRRILREAPGKYTRSYLHTETDAGDATYFLLCQVEVIERAIEQLQGYLRRQVKEIQTVERLLRGSAELNHRQLAVLGGALRNPEERHSFATHATSHGVTHETARTDLTMLAGSRSAGWGAGSASSRRATWRSA